MIGTALMKDDEHGKPRAVKFKVDEESDSDGLFSDGDMIYDSSDSDSSELEAAGGYYTKEMFLKKYVFITPVMSLIVSSLPLLYLIASLPLFCPVVITPIVCCHVLCVTVSLLCPLCHHYPCCMLLCGLPCYAIAHCIQLYT